MQLLSLEQLVMLLELKLLVLMKVDLIVLATSIFQKVLAGDTDRPGGGATQRLRRRCVKRRYKSWEEWHSHMGAVVVFFRIHAGRNLVKVCAVELVVVGEVVTTQPARCAQ
jgi:hypothetical protein